MSGSSPKSARDVLVDVSVGVDQTRQHELAGDMDDSDGIRWNDVAFHGCDPTVADCNIVVSVYPRGRTYHASALEQQIIFFACNHHDTFARPRRPVSSPSSNAWLTTTSTGVGENPAAGLCCCGQLEMTTITGISARKST